MRPKSIGQGNRRANSNNGVVLWENNKKFLQFHSQHHDFPQCYTDLAIKSMLHSSYKYNNDRQQLIEQKEN